jgi:glycosyltransferase involved in cell wall biosynthesis
MTIVVTTFNEAENIANLLADIGRQAPPAGELVIVDGGSSDATLGVVRRWATEAAPAALAVKVIELPGANIARGRNVGIAKARGPHIAVTDAGCRLPYSWYGDITAPLCRGEADFVGGFFRPIARTRFQRVLAQLTISQTLPRGFLPSSRSVAFTKEAWERAGGYPEHLHWGEDSAFDLRCLAAGARYRTVADAVVDWEVRRSARAALEQYHHYAVGDGVSRRMTTSLIAGVVWASTILVLILNGLPALALIAFFGYPLLHVVRHRVALREWGIAYPLSLGLQVSRLVGFLRGLVTGLLRKR